jgi:photosystem II stability/assembly factor-like uncharacterized protein
MTRKALFGLGLWIALTAAMPVAATEWRPAPIYGGDVRSLAVVPDQPDVLLAGTSAGQVYISQNGGRNWKDAGAALPFPGWVVSKLVFDPNRTAVPRVWVALWGVWGGGQVAYSDDLGKSWSARSAGLPEEPVYTLALTPGHEGRLFAGTLSGVYGSEDGGASWKRLTADLPEMAKVTSLLVDPSQPDTVIAGTWRQAYRSDDGGKTWAGIFQGMVLDTEVFSLTPIPDHPGEIWASSCGWVYQTVDRGSTWVRFKTGLDERRTPSFAALPDGRLLAGTVSGLYASTDVGRTWARISDPALSVMAIAVDPARPERIVLGTEGAGVWLSTDGGKFFERASRGMTNTRIAALALAGDDLLVAVNDAGPLSGIHVSHDRGKTFDGLSSRIPTILGMAVHKGRPYAATERGLYQRLGQDWHRVAELGDSRVEQVLADGATLVARTPAKLYELKGDRFVEKPWKHGLPRSAALLAGALWVTDDKGLYRLTEGANHTILTPKGASGRLDRLADRLLFWSPEGAWTRRDDPEALWVELPAKPNRVIPTGDARYPLLLVTGDRVELMDRETKGLKPLDLPVPARDVTSALVLDGKLLVGTSGYGVLVAGVE